MTSRRSSRVSRSIGEASDLLKSIANPNRLSIVCMLLEGERSVAELETKLGIHQPTLSQQLCELRDAGVVVTRRVGKRVFYRVSDQRAARLIGTLRDIFSELETWCAEFSNGVSAERARSPSVDLMMSD